MILDNEFPDRIRLTDIQMKLYEIVHISHDNPEIKGKLMEALKLVEEVDKRASEWRSIMFQVANKIN